MNKRLVQVLFACGILIVVGISVYHREQFDVTLIEQWIHRAGWWGPVIFILIYILSTVFFLPGSVLTLAGGALFGPVMGTLYNVTGATIGAALSFLIARYIASDYVATHAGGRLKQLINGVENEGWRFVAFVRLVPLFPFNLLNYALGLTKIRFIEYLIATYLFILPGGIAYTYLGYAGREVAAGGDGLIKILLIALALLAVVLFLPRFIATIRRGPSIDVTELKQRIEQNQTLVLDVRTENEFHNSGHIDKAFNIPVDRLEKELSSIEEYFDKSISIVCRTDKRSAKAANILLKHGYQDVRVVKGGMTDWNKIYPDYRQNFKV